MSSEPLGAHTSKPEVTNVGQHGIWLLLGERELFMSYENFPWFMDVPVKSIFKIEEPSPGHYYWPDLDVDLTADMIERPQQYPLKARH